MVYIQKDTMAGRIPSHTIASISAAAQILSKDYKIPSIPRALVSPILRKTDTDTTPEETNERFYVDETNMVERRFLKDATEEFEPERDVDVFAKSDLHSSMLECALAHPSLKDVVSTIATSQFLTGGGSSLLEIAPRLREEPAFETGRIQYQKEYPAENSQDAVSILVDSSHDEYSRTRALAFLTGQPLVIEDETGKVRINGPSPQNESDMVYWIRGVVDGWLGITMTAGDAEKRFKESALTRYNPDPEQNGSPLIRHKKIRVAELRSAYEYLNGEKPKNMKKAELIRSVSAACLWGIHIPSIVRTN